MPTPLNPKASIGCGIMVGLPGDELQCMREERQDGAKSARGSGRAARQIDQQRPFRNAAHTTAEDRERGFLSAFATQEFRNAGHQAVADGECGFRCVVPGTHARAAGRDNQVDTGRNEGA